MIAGVDSICSVVLNFLKTPGGELRCRATDVRTRESWLVESGTELWSLIFGDREKADGLDRG
ncbi:MAG TPA: hypothetical protein VGX96_17570 [Candidatus Elarobacter sp.]|jgi:hypothetical protein|nr:hypothetical protein [Candidatus Elarobacter sp.]